MMTAMLEVRNVRKSYGAVEVLKGVSFSVAPRETFAIIGPNGAGKTTLFKVITGEVETGAGEVLCEGADVTTLPAWKRTRLGFGRTFQVARIFGGSTVRDNLIASIEARRRNKGLSLGPWYSWRPSKAVIEEAMAAAEGVGLGARSMAPASLLSHGDKKRLEIALTLSLEPRILMMDEPCAGMSPSDREQTVELIRTVRQKHGITVVLTEHDMDVVFGLADRVMVLNYGESIAVGTASEVRNNAAVREIYLGEEMHNA
ncbi:MAG: ABC transporter ATP-binding protein [Burkholderiaceae bacterium]|nr:ABC transporter ATP-binding protein [Burkholderiaceae bacterium]